MPNSIQLYDFQENIIDVLRDRIREGHRKIMLCSPTGSGKSVCAGFLIGEAMDHGTRSLFLADRIVLVQQARRQFWSFGIPSGMIQGRNREGRSMQTLVCSQQTLERYETWPESQLIIVDEAHTQRQKITKNIQATDACVLGMSATPVTDGLGKTYSTVVNVATTDYLLNTINPATDLPYLAPLKIYAGVEIDMQGATTDNKGEWLTREVTERSATIIGDVVPEYIEKTMKHFGGPVKTLVFSADTDSGAAICERFQEAGLDFRQSTYRDSPEKTADMVEGFRRGDYLGLTSVEKFAKGFDVPDVLCVILCRPYRTSFAAFLQALGRGMRASPGKQFVLILDFSGNVAGHYDDMIQFFAEGCNSLDDGNRKSVKRKEGAERQDVLCHQCGFVLGPGSDRCLSCGAAKHRRKAKIEQVKGVMEEVDFANRNKLPEWASDNRWVWTQICLAAITKRPDDSDWARRYAYGHYKQLYGKWPSGGFIHPKDGSMTVDTKIAGYMAKQDIAYRKRKR